MSTAILIGSLVASLAACVYLYFYNLLLRRHLRIEREAVNTLCRRMGLHAIRGLRPIDGCTCDVCLETRRLAN